MKEIGLWRALCNDAPLATFAYLKSVVHWQRAPCGRSPGGVLWVPAVHRAHNLRPQREEDEGDWASPDAPDLLESYLRAMTNAYGVVLDDASLRWAAAESVPETVIAAICLLENEECGRDRR
jgi:hypothetical protein